MKSQHGGAEKDKETLIFVNNLHHDPFADDDEDGEGGASLAVRVDIRIQQRNGRKSVTTIEGLPEELDYKKILKVAKKAFSCNGSIQTKHDRDREREDLLNSPGHRSAERHIIQLQGDHRREFRDFLINENLALPENIKVHGF